MWCPICSVVELERKEKIELIKPWAGWSHLYLRDEKGEEFQGALSYINCVPWNLIEMFEVYLDTNVEPAYTFDEEGTEWTLILSRDFTRILYQRDKIGGMCLFIEAGDLIKAVCTSLLENIDDWVRFDYFDEDDEKLFEADKKRMIESINKILEKLNEKRDIR